MAETITDDDARYALNLVRAICTEVGPGLPGSAQERERAARIGRELEAHLGTGGVVVEEFTAALGAFLGSLPLCAVLLLVAAALNMFAGHWTGAASWAGAVAALAFSVLAVLIFVIEFLLDREFVDPLFQRKQSINVVGALRGPGTQDVKRLLIVSGHHDSAPEMTWMGLLGYGTIIASATAFMGFIVMLTMSIIQLAGVMTSHAATVQLGTLGWGLLAYPIVPAVIYGLFFNRGRRNGGTVPGAVDNLAASALTVALCRFLVNNTSCIPADTEIRFISFGSEEAGLRGSRRYVERHLDELRRLDARLLNFEMVAHPEITILTSDVNGTVKNSPELVKSVVAAAERAGVPYKVKRAFLGVGTDAAPFSWAGLKATALLPVKMPQQWVAFYHQRTDTPDVLTLEPLANVLKLALEWIRAGGE